MTLGAGQYWGDAFRRWDLDGLAVSLTRYSGIERQARHRHVNPTFFFLLKGQFGDVSEALGSCYPKRFEILFHPAGAWHEGISGPDGRIGVNIEPSPDWLGRNGLVHKDLGPYRVESDPMRSSELLRMVLNGFSCHAVNEQMVELMTCFNRDRMETPAWYRRLDDLLAAGTHWRLLSLATELGVHPVYLARVFRARHGCSVTESLSRRRLLSAVGPLLDGLPSSRAAHEAGFADQSHFGRACLAFTGRTPRELQREAHRQGFISSSSAVSD